MKPLKPIRQTIHRQRDAAQLKLQSTERELCTAFLALAQQLTAAAAAKDAASAAADVKKEDDQLPVARGAGGRKRPRAAAARGRRGVRRVPAPTLGDEGSGGEGGDDGPVDAAAPSPSRRRVRFTDGGGAGDAAAGDSERGGEEDEEGAAPDRADAFDEPAADLRAAALKVLEDGFQVGRWLGWTKHLACRLEGGRDRVQQISSP